VSQFVGQSVTQISVSARLGQAAGSPVVVSSYTHPGERVVHRECGSKRDDDD
jgi:hypothetical protein